MFHSFRREIRAIADRQVPKLKQQLWVPAAKFCYYFIGYKAWSTNNSSLKM